ncbi:hypothetical protein K431DRAFT_345405 [Polychaeton citri CBS 116435]|uniref:Nucleoside phosphorylase domain-containing protein n=1 Tax=Polychaeton citri CBS 116435 TaxID=1314669 RepID=A0A9P4Q8P2_9PEZI|nr:hypothetical protein K431DRAFT_345405 [Polychaeton citri CBS 116435]
MGKDYGKSEHDRSSGYTTGLIEKRPVVIASPRGIDVLNAANQAAEMSRISQNIKLAMLVGVTGGAPFTPKPEPVPIFLGDIIISTSVIHYDFGWQYTDGYKRKKGIEDILGRANQEVATFVSGLQRRRALARITNQMNGDIAELCQRCLEFASPGPEQDHFFPSDYRRKHQTQQGCSTCDKCQQWDHLVCEAAEKSSCDELKCVDRCLIPEPANIVAFSGDTLRYSRERKCRGKERWALGSNRE